MKTKTLLIVTLAILSLSTGTIMAQKSTGLIGSDQLFENMKKVDIPVAYAANKMSFESPFPGKWTLFQADGYLEPNLDRYPTVEAQDDIKETIGWYRVGSTDELADTFAYHPVNNDYALRFHLSDNTTAYRYRLIYEDATTGVSEEFEFYWVLLPEKPVMWNVEVLEPLVASDNNSPVLSLSVEVLSRNATDYWLSYPSGDDFNNSTDEIPQCRSTLSYDRETNRCIIKFDSRDRCLGLIASNEFGLSIGEEKIEWNDFKEYWLDTPGNTSVSDMPGGQSSDSEVIKTLPYGSHNLENLSIEHRDGTTSKIVVK